MAIRPVYSTFIFLPTNRILDLTKNESLLQMKRIVIAICVLGFFVSCQQGPKIAYVDTGKVINEYQEKIDIEEKYKGKDELFTKKTDSVSKAFQLEAQEFQLKAKRMSTANAQKAYEELGQKQQLLQQQLQFEQQQLQQAFDTEIDSTIKKIRNFVQDYGKANGYNYILGTSDALNTVMYGEEVNDLTQAIIDELNSSYKKN